MELNETDDSQNCEDLFYFESDHLALKGNQDYSDLLKTLFILQAQRNRAIEDYKKVVELQKEAESNPWGIVEKLKNGEGLNVPELQVVADVPKLNWNKYDVKIPENLLSAVTSIDDDDAKKSCDLKQISSNSKTKAWTVEEQKRLEELLIIYPPEEVELRRFKKIAGALGTRTVKQVCSRVQKYFLKLKKAGLPIPGRIPRLNNHKSKYKHQQLNYHSIRPSTFFPEHIIPVMMNENEDAPGPSQNTKPSESTFSSNSNNYLLDTKYHQDKEEKVENESAILLNFLTLIRAEKHRETCEDACLFQHFGYKCDFCEEDPICGSRWHCITCQTTSVDYCTDCMVSQMYSTKKHPLSHKFLIIRDDQHNINAEIPTSKESSSTNSWADSSSDVDSEELENFIKSENHDAKVNGMSESESYDEVDRADYKQFKRND